MIHAFIFAELGASGGLPLWRSRQGAQPVILVLDVPLGICVSFPQGVRRVCCTSPIAFASPPGKTSGAKRKMQAPAFDMEALQQMLRQQTETLQASQKQSMDRLESRSIKRMEGLERSILERFKLVDDRLAQQDAKIDNLAKENASLVDRIGMLEKRESSTAVPSRSEPEKNLNTVVLGGWPKDTKREVIVVEAKTVVDRLGLGGRLEQAFWSPGVRSSVALATFSLQQGETADDLRSRMVHVVTAIGWAKLSGPSLPPGKTYWCTISKPREERLRSSHASKVRLLHSLDQDILLAETEYASGTAWYKDTLIASAVRQMPAAAVAGRTPGSWLAASVLANLAAVDEQKVRAAWEACFGN